MRRTVKSSGSSHRGQDDGCADCAEPGQAAGQGADVRPAVAGFPLVGVVGEFGLDRASSRTSVATSAARSP